MILSLIFIHLAAMFNAVMDKTKDTIQYDSSIFYNRDPLFWDDQRSKSEFIIGTKYKPNAWHISKSIAGCLLLALPFTYKSLFGGLDYLIFLTMYIQSFNLYKDHVFKKRDK